MALGHFSLLTWEAIQLMGGVQCLLGATVLTDLARNKSAGILDTFEAQHYRPRTRCIHTGHFLTRVTQTRAS